MKKLLLLCCAVIGISAASRAQGGPPAPADQAAALKTSLSLNDAQTAKITAIYTTQRKSIDSLMNAGGDFSAFRPMMTATNAKIKAVLTPEQAAAFQKQQDEFMKRMQEGGGPPPPQR